MATEIKIDPITRIEGHLGVTVNVDGGKVVEARCSGTMFRGFETILIGRDPRDAPVLTQRICGVCHQSHRIAGVRALENAAAASVPEGARKMRNLIEAVTTLYSHALWFYALGGPDYSDAVTKNGLKRLDPITGQGYREAVANQRKLHEVLSILGAKVPHQMTYIHGGLTHEPSVEKILAMKTRILEVSDWIGKTSDLPAVLDDVSAGKHDYSKGYVLNDVVDWAVFALKEKADTWGVGHQKYISYGVYDMADGSSFLPSGVWDGGKVIPMDEKKITEYVKYSWYTDDSGGVTRDSPMLKIAPDKAGAYSWAKTPRYGTMPVEGGPLARMVIAGLDPFDLRKKLGGGAEKASTFNRIIARMQEALILRDKIVEWIDELKHGEKTYADFKVPDNALGVGLWEAPRGPVGHWTDIKVKKISRYQVIAGTTWNATPRDDMGQRGVIEEALIGAPVPDVKNPVNVVRTVRSYDPCLACTVHVMTPKGQKYSVQVT
ncbi:MAG: nickel-dependent hydrogenase large subunit [Candidatus Methanoperedens sp.]|nr:nickel-dependent hydrogenase large subunit [Candidatus Methanoperedens sp.]